MSKAASMIAAVTAATFAAQEHGNTPNSIVMWDHPALKTICSPLARDESTEFIKLMRDTLAATRNGVGLAAPQIGVTKRVIMLRPNGRIIETCINPIITWASDEKEVAGEGCLSYPDVTAEIERAKSIRLTYSDLSWKPITRLLMGWEARIAQHEIDHLDGICRVGDAWRAGK